VIRIQNLVIDLIKDYIPATDDTDADLIRKQTKAIELVEGMDKTYRQS
jgi:hypothetical protein